MLDENEIPTGTRVKMSELGSVRCPRLAGNGTVVGRGIYRNNITVLFDGNPQSDGA